jgi:hypothetical protein
MTLSTILGTLAIVAISLCQTPALAASVRTSFTLSARVVDGCAVELGAQPGAAAGTVSLHTACSTGAASVAELGPGGVVAHAASKGAPTRLTTAFAPKTLSDGRRVMVVTLSF